jgi:hypothetical protein
VAGIVLVRDGHLDSQQLWEKTNSLMWWVIQTGTPLENGGFDAQSVVVVKELLVH